MEDRFKFRFLVTYFDDDANENRIVMQYSDNLDPEVSGSYLFYRDEDVIIQQCTGLKDENGKLIFEGDIVRIFHVSGTMQGKLFTDVVEWNELRCRFDTENYGVFDENDIYEVIGNIYENKDLLNA